MEKRIRYTIGALIWTIGIVVGFLFWRVFQPTITIFGIVGVVIFFITNAIFWAVRDKTMSPEEKAKEEEMWARRLKELKDLEERERHMSGDKKKKGLWTRFWDEIDGTATRERLAEMAEKGICDYCSKDIRDRYYTCTTCEEVFCSQKCYYGHERDVHDR